MPTAAAVTTATTEVAATDRSDNITTTLLAPAPG